MTEKHRVKVNFEELSAAFELNFPGQDAYLDLETGDVVWVTDETRMQLKQLWENIPNTQEPLAALEALLAQRTDIADWQQEEIRNACRVEADYGNRYLSVAPEPYSDYNDMERFIWELADKRLADKLDNAIQGRGAFRRFKDILARYPQVQQAWYDFQARQIEIRMQEWLEAMNIEPLE